MMSEGAGPSGSYGKFSCPIVARQALGGKMQDEDIHRVMGCIAAAVTAWPTPAVTVVSQREGDPFKVLVSCILSLRTHDRTTGPASERLFKLGSTPADLLR